VVTISGAKSSYSVGPKIAIFSLRGSAPHPAGATAPDPGGWGCRPRPRLCGATAPDPVYIRSGLPDGGPSPRTLVSRHRVLKTC
jgi:hypothetical protein